VYVYNKEKKKDEHQMKLHVDGEVKLKVSSTQCNRILQYSVNLESCCDGVMMSLVSRFQGHLTTEECEADGRHP
jgi:hypothetical protein